MEVGRNVVYIIHIAYSHTLMGENNIHNYICKDILIFFQAPPPTYGLATWVKKHILLWLFKSLILVFLFSLNTSTSYLYLSITLEIFNHGFYLY